MQAVQAHYVPKHAHYPVGPFPPELQGFNPRRMGLTAEGSDFSDVTVYDEEASPAAQPEVVSDYIPEQNTDGLGFELGATAQNNFRPEKRYVCKMCDARVMESQLDFHECEE